MMQADVEEALVEGKEQIQELIGVSQPPVAKSTLGICAASSRYSKL